MTKAYYQRFIAYTVKQAMRLEFGKGVDIVHHVDDANGVHNMVITIDGAVHYLHIRPMKSEIEVKQSQDTSNLIKGVLNDARPN